VAVYLTIPGVVDGEALDSVDHDGSGRGLGINLRIGQAASELFQAARLGRLFDVMLLTFDNGSMALEDVTVSSASSTNGYVSAALDVRQVRWV